MKGLLALLDIALFAFPAAAELEQKIDRNFDALNTDGDDQLSWEEVEVSSAKEHFNQMDKDTNGRVSRTEFESYTTAHPGSVEDKAQSPSSPNEASRVE